MCQYIFVKKIKKLQIITAKNKIKSWFASIMAKKGQIPYV